MKIDPTSAPTIFVKGIEPPALKPFATPSKETTECDDPPMVSVPVEGAVPETLKLKLLGVLPETEPD